jgi:hypothetical protein
MKALNVLKYIGFGILGVGFVIGVIFGVQALWNWLVPDLFNGPELNYWQTIGLFILSKILFTGIAPGGSDKKHDKKWKKRFEDRCREKSAEDQIIPASGQV